MINSVQNNISCYHCGDDCSNDSITSGDKLFCCSGCKLVFEVLSENNLCSYYNLNERPGIKKALNTSRQFNYLDEVSIQQKLISFRRKNEVHITFIIPSIHCSSCIWLLENFRKVDSGVLTSRVNFLKKELFLVYDESKTSLRKLAEALSELGYEPIIHLDSLEKKVSNKNNHDRILRIGIAGFCFGNIMMLSFPEYFSSGKIHDPGLKYFFSYLILFISLPVFLYSASEFFIKSYQSIKQRTTSIDVPIALGIIVIFLRSSYEIITNSGPGYLDSGSGLIFFMLAGRWFQDHTFDYLSFERDYKSYFPIAVNTLKNGIEKIVEVSKLKVNDKIIIRNNEIIPVDAILINGIAQIDYSFVTGESSPVKIEIGEQVYAGGRQSGSILEMLVSREISQSHLTRLWNENKVKNDKSVFEILVTQISRYFIFVTLSIAFTAGIFWWNTDINKAINAFTSVLIIACPCALALSAPFTYGNILRILGKKKIFLRNYQVLERMADITNLIFDKTGTITENNFSDIEFIGEELNSKEQQMIYSLLRNSSHPLSKRLTKFIGAKYYLSTTQLNEVPGMGISGMIENILVMAGSQNFVKASLNEQEVSSTHVFISFNEVYKGYYILKNQYRKGIKELFQKLNQNKLAISILSGDNNSSAPDLAKFINAETDIKFNQTPNDKLEYIKNLQKDKYSVMMVGDGLNDAGALKQSNVGISIADDTNNFTPASDIIMEASQLSNIYRLISYSKAASRIVIISFIISLLYNFVGLYFAVTGTLSPLIAAILMPISTISLVLFTVTASTLVGRQLFSNKK